MNRYVLIICFLFVPFFMHAQNLFDQEGKRHGLWEKYYEDGSIRYRGSFNHGKEVGVFEFYDLGDTKNPVIIKEFAEDGSAQCMFFEGGKLSAKGEMKGKQKEGLWQYYRSDGSLQSQEVYKGNNLNGQSLIYHPNGQIMEQCFYVENQLEGPFLRYKKDGTLLLELNYSLNRLNGSAVYYTEQGVVSSKGTYVNGDKSNDWEYFIDGKQVSEKEYSTKKN